MIGLYAFILCIAGLVAYGIYELYQYMQRKSAAAELSKPGEEAFKLNDLLRRVHDGAAMGSNKAVTKNPVDKVSLIEGMNIMPKDLKRLISKLSSKGLVKETNTAVSITPFGVQFFKTFSNDKLNIGS